MTNGGPARFYAVLVALIAFLVHLQHEAARARQVLARRYAAYRVALRVRERRIAHVRVEQARLDTLAANAWAPIAPRHRYPR